MHAVAEALEAFFEQLASVSWGALGIAVALHLGKLLARSRAWRNVVAAAYPDEPVPWRSFAGAYLAGVGVNAIVPARGGDLLRLFLAKRAVEGSTYPTLAATLLVEAIFDTALTLTLFFWALSLGRLPGIDVLPSLPAVDWLWVLRHGTASAVAVAAVVAALCVLVLWASRRIAEFWRRVAQGVAILRRPREYLRRVVAWQVVEWGLRLGSLYFFLRAFGLPAGVENALLVQIAQSLSTALPFTPSGIGTEQALLVYIFSGEAATSTVLSFSVGMKIVVIAVNALVGFGATALVLRTLRWRDHVDADRPAIERSQA